MLHTQIQTFASAIATSVALEESASKKYASQGQLNFLYLFLDSQQA